MARVSLAMSVLAFLAFEIVAWLSAAGQQRTAQLLAAIACLVGVWSAVTGLSFWGRRNGPAVRHRIVYRYFVVLAIVDAVFTVALSESTVYGSRKGWRKAAADHVASLDLTERGLTRQLSTDSAGLPLNNNLLSKTPVLNSYIGLINTFHDEYAQHRVLGPSALGSQRIWFSPHGVRVPLTADCFRPFVAAAERLGRPCLVLSDRQERFRSPSETVAPALLAETARELAEAPPAEPVPVTLVEYSPNRLVFEAHAPGKGWLLVTDRWAAGWRAAVNGENVEVRIGNFIFRAVPVHQGLNRVDFHYRPFGHPWLLLLSWTTLGVLLAATVALQIANRRSGARSCCT